MGKLIEVNEKFDYQILEDVAGKPLRVGGEIQLADVKNANGRVYPEALWNKCLEDKRVMTRLGERKMLGELDHPESGKTSLSRVSHVMTSMEMRPSARYEGKQAIYGTYECLSTPSGKILESLLRSKIGLGVSSRGDGDLEERNGAHYVIPESFTLDTFDVVLDPSVDVSLKVMESREGKSEWASHPHTVEAITQAIAVIVESGDYTSTDAEYYRTVLESFDYQPESDSLARANRALANLIEQMEIDDMVKANANGQVPSAGLTESQMTFESLVQERTKPLNDEVATLKQRLATAENRAAAGEALVSELLIRSRDYKMKSEAFGESHARLQKLESRHDLAKSVIERLRDKVLELQGEGKMREAAELLLGTLLKKIDETKRASYVERMIRNESTQVQDRLRPALLSMPTKRAVNEHLKAFRAAVRENDDTTAKRRGLPVREDRQYRRASIVEGRENPLTDATDPNRQEEDRSTPAVKGLEEQVALGKALVKKLRS